LSLHDASLLANGDIAVSYFLWYTAEFFNFDTLNLVVAANNMSSNNPAAVTARAKSTSPDEAVSPAASIGPPVPEPRLTDEELLALSHTGPANREQTVQPVGFTNPGGLCYMNAVIQMLMNLSPFTGFIVNHHAAFYESRIWRNLLKHIGQPTQCGRGRAVLTTCLAP